MHVTMKANAAHMHSKLLLTSSGREGVEKAVVFPSSCASDVVMFSRTCWEQGYKGYRRVYSFSPTRAAWQQPAQPEGSPFWGWLAGLSLLFTTFTEGKKCCNCFMTTVSVLLRCHLRMSPNRTAAGWPSPQAPTTFTDKLHHNYQTLACRSVTAESGFLQP